MPSLTIDDSLRSDQPRPPAPIDVLPDELLLEIFDFGAQSTSNSTFSFLVSTVCQSWRSLAVNEPRLWTSVTITSADAVHRLPIPEKDAFHFSEVFPREWTIVERSADWGFDFSLEFKAAEDEHWPAIHEFQQTHLDVLAHFLAWTAHCMRTFRVTMDLWEVVVELCVAMQGVEMPLLETWDVRAMNTEWSMLDDDYEMGSGAEVIRTLEYSTDDNDHDSRRSLQPALKHVGCSGIPMDWGLFSPAGLQKLCLRYKPKDGRPTIETLYGILLNSKDTLEHLDLSFVVGAHSGPVFELEAPLVLPRVTHLEVGFGCSHEARAVLQVFDFPALRELKVESLTGWKRSDYVVEDVLRYVRVEELVELKLLWVDLFEDAAEALIRELVGRLSRGCLRRLTLDKCTDAFLRIMDYGKEGFLALLSGLKELSVRVSTDKESEDLVSFLHAILESGMVDGVSAGPTLEKLMITVTEIDLDVELERLDDLAEEIRITFL